MKHMLVIIVLFLTACSSREASHLPSLLELPGALISSGIENANYEHKRSKVKRYIVTHYNILKQEVRRGKGMHLSELLQIARISTQSRATVKHAIQHDYQTMFRNVLLSTEATMHAFGALYPAKERTKTTHVFSHTRASSIAQRYLRSHFDAFRTSLQHKSAQGLKPLAQRLRINNPVKRKRFYTSLWARYDALIIEPVVVGVMVHS